jgi:hypothetical protein
MVVTLEGPCNKDLCGLARCFSILEPGGTLTIPNANTAPRPRTIPYPQPTLKGGAIAIFVFCRNFLQDDEV